MPLIAAMFLYVIPMVTTLFFVNYGFKKKEVSLSDLFILSLVSFVPILNIIFCVLESECILHTIREINSNIKKKRKERKGIKQNPQLGKLYFICSVFDRYEKNGLLTKRENELNTQKLEGLLKHIEQSGIKNFIDENEEPFAYLMSVDETNQKLIEKNIDGVADRAKEIFVRFLSASEKEIQRIEKGQKEIEEAFLKESGKRVGEELEKYVDYYKKKEEITK